MTSRHKYTIIFGAWNLSIDGTGKKAMCSFISKLTPLKLRNICNSIQSYFKISLFAFWHESDHSSPYYLKELPWILRHFLPGHKIPGWLLTFHPYQDTPSIFLKVECASSENLGRASIHKLMDTRSAESSHMLQIRTQQFQEKRKAV